jgi:crossover junction endodeoxyribonuclease RusA
MLTVQLPWPDPKLNPNQSKGVHWAGTSALRKRARTDAFWLTRGAMLQNLMACRPDALGAGDVAVTITFVQPDKRRRDRDNILAALKPSLDGLAEAIGVDDSRFEPLTIRRQYGDKPGCVLVTVGA